MSIKLGGAWFRTEGSGRVTVLSRSGRPLRPRTSLGASRRPKTRAVSGLHWGASAPGPGPICLCTDPRPCPSEYHAQLMASSRRARRRCAQRAPGGHLTQAHWEGPLALSSKFTGRACTVKLHQLSEGSSVGPLDIRPGSHWQWGLSSSVDPGLPGRDASPGTRLPRARAPPGEKHP